MQWNVENMDMIVIKHLQLNQTLALNNPLEIDMQLKK